MSTLNIDQARAAFPSLASGFIFGDNAGGSQVAQPVIDRFTDYLINTNAQLGADYSAPEEARKLFNAGSTKEIVFGPSSTANLENLARGLEKGINPGDEFIVTGEHEANAGPWKALAQRSGASVKLWKHTTSNESNPYSLTLRTGAVLPLITSRTRIVAFTACSNILGSIVPVKEFTREIRARAAEVGAENLEISVDCVAYAPHRKIDVQDWDIDFCVFSYYKVYGPHLSALYVRDKSLRTSVSSIVHHFLSPHVDAIGYKLQPQGPGYESVYASTGVNQYLLSLTPSNDLDATFNAIALHEQTLLEPLLNFLNEPKQWKRGVKIVGDEKLSLNRVPTVSFVVADDPPVKSSDIVKVFDDTGKIGIRYGHFYAYTLVDELRPKVDVNDGVIRISLVHTNTSEEVQAIIETLRKALSLS
ncbi:selenocysteine lyase [Coprinellus micaceus]|uniref:Selenocysteine lyase n=1 Tax=Coprinellus micaceus TaxID=71717 RepID=A0A4Y7TDV0_COPMI|nr:selenocysteine lyase [Coprinellus micaceus]